MHQYIRLHPLLLNKLKSRKEGMPSILGMAIVEIKLEMSDARGVVEMQIDPRTYCINSVLLELIKVMSETIPTDPDLPKLPLTLKNPLPTIIVLPK